MAIEIGFQATTCNTATGNQTFTDIGMSETPNAALFIVTEATTTAVGGAAHAVYSIGAATATDEWSISSSNEDAVGTTNAHDRISNSKCVMKLLNDGSAIDGEADWVSFGAGTVTINWSNAMAAAYRIMVFMFAVDNADVGIFNPNTTQNGTTNVTVGFQPNMVICGATNNSSVNSTGGGYETSFGAVDQSLTNYCINARMANNSATASVQASIRNNRCVYREGTGTANWGVEITAYGATTFTSTTRDNNVATKHVGYLAIDTGTSANWVGGIDTPIATGNQGITAPGFIPQAALVGIFNGEAENTRYTNNLGGFLGVGGFEDSGNEASSGNSMEDGVGTTNNNSYLTTDSAHLTDDDGTNLIQTTFISMDANGWTWNVNPTTGTVKKWFGIAIEEAQAGIATPLVNVRSRLATLVGGALARGLLLTEWFKNF